MVFAFYRGCRLKKRYIVIINILIVGLVLFIIAKYANDRATESNRSSIASFEKMTTTTEQIIANYLEDEQHLCDIWANYINRSAEAGEPMTVDEAISYIRKAKISPEISGHLIYTDDGSMAGISTTAASTDPSDYSVNYSHIDVLDHLEVSDGDGVVNLTRAYTNPQNGVQSIAFLNNVQVLDSDTGAMRQGLIIRVVPVSRLEQKLVFLKGEYERQFLVKKSKDLNMPFPDFVDIYMSDIKPRIKYNTYRSKEYIIRDKILPYFKNFSVSSITAPDIVQWQNELLQFRDSEGKSYTATYLRTIQNQLNAIMNHASKYYSLKENPVQKISKMGRAKAKEMSFWTEDEYLAFSEVMKSKPISYYA